MSVKTHKETKKFILSAFNIKRTKYSELNSKKLTFAHSHPLNLIGRLLLNDVEALQDVGDVINSSPASLQAFRHLPEVDRAIGRHQQKLQEAHCQNSQRHIWNQHDTQRRNKGIKTF